MRRLIETCLLTAVLLATPGLASAEQTYVLPGVPVTIVSDGGLTVTPDTNRQTGQPLYAARASRHGRVGTCVVQVARAGTTFLDHEERIARSLFETQGYPAPRLIDNRPWIRSYESIQGDIVMRLAVFKYRGGVHHVFKYCDAAGNAVADRTRQLRAARARPSLGQRNCDFIRQSAPIFRAKPIFGGFGVV